MKLINAHGKTNDFITLRANIDVVHSHPVLSGSWCRLVKISDNNLLFKVRVIHDNQIIFEGSHLRILVSREEFDRTLKALDDKTHKASACSGACHISPCLMFGASRFAHPATAILTVTGLFPIQVIACTQKCAILYKQ